MLTLTFPSDNPCDSAMYNRSANFIYDGNGLRVQKCVPSCGSPTTSTVYVFSGSSVIAEYDNGAGVGYPTREYLYAGGLKVATYDTAIKYHLRDHLSVRVNTDNSGAILGEQGHYPFGEPWYLINTTTKEQFTTYERDAGYPSIRTKALSRHTCGVQCFSHRGIAREVEDRSSGYLTVNHFSVESFHQPSIRPVTSAMILLCESRWVSGRERPINLSAWR